MDTTVVMAIARSAVVNTEVQQPELTEEEAIELVMA
jgi:hypothetical protein